MAANDQSGSHDDQPHHPHGPALRDDSGVAGKIFAEVAGELWSAISLYDLTLVADPFRPTGELQFLLVERARQIRRAERGHSGRLARAFASVTGHGRPRPTARLVH